MPEILTPLGVDVTQASPTVDTEVPKSENARLTARQRRSRLLQVIGAGSFGLSLLLAACRGEAPPLAATTVPTEPSRPEFVTQVPLPPEIPYEGRTAPKLEGIEAVSDAETLPAEGIVSTWAENPALIPDAFFVPKAQQAAFEASNGILLTTGEADRPVTFTKRLVFEGIFGSLNDLVFLKDPESDISYHLGIIPDPDAIQAFRELEIGDVYDLSITLSEPSGTPVRVKIFTEGKTQQSMLPRFIVYEVNSVAMRGAKLDSALPIITQETITFNNKPVSELPMSVEAPVQAEDTVVSEWAADISQVPEYFYVPASQVESFAELNSVELVSDRAVEQSGQYYVFPQWEVRGGRVVLPLQDTETQQSFNLGSPEAATAPVQQAFLNVAPNRVQDLTFSYKPRVRLFYEEAGVTTDPAGTSVTVFRVRELAVPEVTDLAVHN